MTNALISNKSVVDQLRDAMVAKGLTAPADIIDDGQIHRFSTNGKPDDDAGWYILNDGDVPTGSFGDWRTGEVVRNWIADIGRPLSPTERNAFYKKQEDMVAKRQEEIATRQAAAKAKATTILGYSSPARDGYAYLVKKDVHSYGLRWWQGTLLVPAMDATGEVQSLQFISEDGDKRFLTGGKVKGCYFPLGGIKSQDYKTSDIILIAEGYATAATIYEVTGHPVIVAYHAGNLVAVAKTIRAQNPHAKIYVCADDDWKTKGNPGLTAATEAANAVDGQVLKPDFGADRQDSMTDFNDMAAQKGKDAVTRFFTAQFLQNHNQVHNISTDDLDDQSVDAMDAFLSNPDHSKTSQPESTNLKTHAASKHPEVKYPVDSHPAASPTSPPQPSPASPPPFTTPPSESIAELKTHFASDEYAAVQKIWKQLPRSSAYHTNTGYHILLDEKHKVIVTKDKIELSHKARHRPDTAYVAACQHAHQFWNRQMEVQGDRQHRIKAWAYAAAYGVQVTNYKPTDNELIEADKMLNTIRESIEPGFSRPNPQAGKQPNVRPSAKLDA